MNNLGSFGKSFALSAQSSECFAVKKNHIVKFFILITLYTVAPIIVYGQSDKLTETIIEIAEELAMDETDPEAVSVFIERLHELAENPVKINSKDEDEIARLFFLSDFQVKALKDYTSSSGRIVSIFELAAIPGFDKETAEMIIPFITLDYNSISYPDSVRWRNTVISNFILKSGNNDPSLMGSDWRMLSKYKFTAGGFTGGFTIEKDAGEKLFTGHPPLPDFLSTYVAFNGRGLIKKIIIGDFSARLGQGTNINTGIRRSMSLSAPGVMSAGDEIKPYTSTDENKFFRGVAAEFSVKNLELKMFYSKNYTDATIISSDTSNDFIDNFYISGVHNTQSLLQKKDVIYILAYGINLLYNFKNLKTGCIWSETRLSLPVNPAINVPEKLYSFTGETNKLFTVYYNTFIKRILLYGELSVDGNKGNAFIQGLSLRPADRLSISFLYRNYNSGYTTFYGQGPGSSSKTSNEKGILGNFSYEAAKHLFISGGCDIQNFPWLKYRCSAPSSGIRKEIKARYLASEKLVMEASYNYRLSIIDDNSMKPIPDQIKIITRSLRTSFRYSIYDNLISGTRIDYKVAYPSKSRGFSLFQELNYRFRKIPLTFWTRYCLFNTDDWDSRIYTYENDLLYSYSIPALAGEGSRSYIMVKWEMQDFAELRIKYGLTSLLANGNSVKNTNEIKMQLRIWF